VAAASDVRSGKIPNWLTGGGLLAGLLLYTYLYELRGLEAALLGALVGGGTLFPFFLVRGIGAGDVKLLAAATAWVGIHHSVAMIFATAIAGGVLAMGYVVSQGRTWQVFQRTGELMQFHVHAGIRQHPDFSLTRSMALRVPYSLAITAGALYVVISTSPLMQR